MGSKRLGLKALRKIYSLSPESLIGILTIDDRKDTRNNFDDFIEFSNEINMPVTIAKNKEHSETVISNFKPDICMVVGWYWLISSQTLSSVPRGFIGIHNSLLPKYRGGSPLIWSIINNEPRLGCSLFSFTDRMDDGHIWAQKDFPLEENDYISDVLLKLETKAVELLEESYNLLLEDKIMPVKQNHELATYCSQRYPEDGNIPWNKPVRYIYNFIRAQSDPYPGAFTYYKGQKIKIWKADLFPHEYFGTPGHIVKIESNGVYVICGDNKAIILEEVETPDKRGKANEIINSVKTCFSCTHDKS